MAAEAGSTSNYDFARALQPRRCGKKMPVSAAILPISFHWLHSTPVSLLASITLIRRVSGRWRDEYPSD